MKPLCQLSLVAAALLVSRGAHADVKPKSPIKSKTQAQKSKDVKPNSAPKPTPRPTVPPDYEVARFDLPPLTPYDYGYRRQPPVQTTAPPFKSRGIVYLPKGSTNVARYKPVTASDERPVIGTHSMVTDGVKEASKNTFVQFGPGPQWVQIDLLGFYEIHGILLWHYHRAPGVFRDVVIQLSGDPEFAHNLRTVYNNDHDNTLGFGIGKDREFYESHQGQWIPFKTQTARYVRLYSNGNSYDRNNHYTEVEVWAMPAWFDPNAKPGVPPGHERVRFELPPSYYSRWPRQIRQTTALRNRPERGTIYLPKGAANVARGKRVYSSDEAPIIGTLKMVTDGEKNIVMRQSLHATDYDNFVELGFGTQWVQIDLQKSFDVHGVLLWHFYGDLRIYRDVIIQLADDADFTKNVRTVFNNDDDNSSGLGKGSDREFYESYQGQWIPIKSQKARYVRLYSRGNSSDPQNQYTEVEVWATPVKQ